MSPAGFRPGVPASERPHTHVLDRAAKGHMHTYVYKLLFRMFLKYGNSLKINLKDRSLIRNISEKYLNGSEVNTGHNNN